MTRAYVLIETSVGKTREVLNALRAVPEAKTIDVVTGPYDIIAVLEAEDLSGVGKVVTDKVHTINGVVRTITCLAFSP